MMKRELRLLVGLLLCWVMSTSFAQGIPTSPSQVAGPGGKLPGNAAIELVKVAEGFESPVNITNAGDGSGRIFVVERTGRVKLINGDGSVAAKPFLDLTVLRPTVINPIGNDVQTEFIEQGLLSIAFDPAYRENGYFYIHYTSVRENGAGVIARYQVDPKSPDMVSAARARATEKMLLRIEQPSYNNNGGTIIFGPDGYLYVGLGDGGWASPDMASQKLSTRLGKILRLDVSSDAGYKAAPNNPFAAKGGKPQDEIWVTGLHNPYKFSFDQRSGAMFIADVGDNTWEEINYVPASSKGGENFGWPVMEGSDCYRAQNSDQPKTCDRQSSLPIAQYRHPEKKDDASDASQAFACASVQGLGVGSKGALDGVYLFGDWCSGQIHGVGWDDANKKWQMEMLLQTKLHITAGGLDEQGNVLVLSAKFYFDDQNPTRPPYGTIWRIANKKP